MSVTIGDVLRLVDGIAPFCLSEEWDNTGLLAGSTERPVTKVLCALDLSEAVIDEALTQAGVDVARAKADLATNKASIDALLKRNSAQAQEFGFHGTPAVLVGSFRVPGGLTAEQFKLAIADARKAAKDGAGK